MLTHPVSTRTVAPRFRVVQALLACLLGCVLAAPAAALQLAAPFVDHAVLQREMPVPVWGWGKPGSKVTVAFAGQKKTATVGKNGKWMVKLDALKASAEGKQLVVSSNASDTVTIEDVLVGEVWMATGQSNMQWTAGKSDVGRVLQRQIAERVEAGKEKAPVIREAKVTDFYAALHPVEHATVKWSKDQSGFSAIAFAFAYKLHEKLGVPIGILNGAFSTTKIQAWIPRVGFRDGKDAYTQKLYMEILQSDPSTPEHKAAWEKFYKSIEDTIESNKARVAAGKEPQDIPTNAPGNFNGNRDSSWMFNARVNPMVPYAIRGAIWNQGYASQSEGLRYYENLHSMIRGWRLVWDRPDLPVYFHQFYRGGNSASGSPPTLSSTSEMRLATWLAARDIPNADMASQIDIGGSIHYGNKTLPGFRLAYHALKNQYGKDIVASGPTFKSYTVKGNKLIVEFDHADGGLVVANTMPNMKSNLAIPKVIPNGESKVNLFYLAGEDRVWHQAKMKIEGDKVVLTAPGVKSPRGVSYAAEGVGFQPNLYNKALLPTTPFIYYDNKLVTSENWPAPALKVAGVEPPVAGLAYHYRKMPVLSTQFRDNAVLQAGQPVTIWGSAVHPWVHFGAQEKRTKGRAVIHFDFDGLVQAVIPVRDDMLEWQVTLPPMEASSKPRTLSVKFTIDGELVHERTAKNIVIGEVWYVASVGGLEASPPTAKGKYEVRMMARQAKRSRGGPSRFSVAVSTTPKNRFASTWKPATGFAAALGQRIAAKTGHPVGIIYMQTPEPSKKDPKPAVYPRLSSWIPAECLKGAPSLMEDYKQLAAIRPGNEYYDANARRYIADWKKYWSEYIAELIATGKVPDAAAWGSYPKLAAGIDTEAGQTYNVMTHSFTPTALKGIVFVTGPSMFPDQGATFGEQFTALANCWMKRFDAKDPLWVYTMPSKALAPKITAPKGISGKTKVFEMKNWPGKEAKAEADTLIEQIVKEAY